MIETIKVEWNIESCLFVYWEPILTYVVEKTKPDASP